MANIYFKSEDVKVYPSAFRGPNIDPEAALPTEYNLIRSGGILNGTGSYIIEYLEDSKILKCVIGGYYFEIANINTYSLNGKYLCIKLKELNIDSNDSPKTKVLYSWDDITCLDDENGGTFTGINIKDTSDGDAFLMPFDTEGNINKKVYLPEIKHGSGDNSFEIGHFEIRGEDEGANGATGDYSFASGYNTEAKGIAAVAINKDTIAEGDYSFAQGNGTTAQAEGSHAEGYKTKALSGYAHAEGNTTQAINNAAHSEGSSTTAKGVNSHAEGVDTLTGTTAEGAHAEGYGAGGNSSLAGAFGAYSHVEGYKTKTDKDAGLYAHAEGEETKANNRAAHAEGYKTNASGINSHAEGIETEASGEASHAEGNSAIASGDSTHAEGLNTKTNGDYSHAEGDTTEASGAASHTEGFTTKTGEDAQYAHAEGQYTEANGIASHAEGIGTADKHLITSGLGSHAEGYQTKAVQSYSHAEGNNTITNGEASHTEGIGTQTGENATGAHAEGKLTTASGTYAHTEGDSTIASGNTSHAEGFRTKASGEYTHAEGEGNDAEDAANEINNASGKASHSEGFKTQAQGDYSHTEGYLAITVENATGAHAEGYNTKALKVYSHAEGYSTQANSQYSHAEGQGSTVSGDDYLEENPGAPACYARHAEGNYTEANATGAYSNGYYTQANGKCSVALGMHTIAHNDNELVIGKYNKGNAGDGRAFVIGDGSSNNPKNAFEILVGQSAEQSLAGNVNIKIGETDLKSIIEGTILNVVYPIGSFYISTETKNDVCPLEAIFPESKWERIKNAFLYAAGDNDQDQKTGIWATWATGDKYKTQKQILGSKDAIVVEHSHVVADSGEHTGAHTHNTDETTIKGELTVKQMYPNQHLFEASTFETGTNVFSVTQDAGGTTENTIDDIAGTKKARSKIILNAGHTHTISNSGEHIHTILSEGVPGTDKNMPPYLCVYMWRRIK